MQLRDRLRFETLLADISSRFVSVPADRIDAEIQGAQREICNCLGVEHSSVWQVVPEDPAIFVLTHLVRDPDLPLPPQRMESKNFFPWAQSKLISKEMICLPDVLKAPAEAARDLATWQKFGVKSALGIPLSAGGGPVFGVLSFEGMSTTRKWPKELLGRLQVLANVFANVLARKQAELKLRESEARVTLAAESANAGLWTLNPATGEIWASDVTYQLFGFQPGELLTLERLFSVVHPPHRDPIRQAIEGALLRPEASSIEYRISRADGERWMSSRGRRHSSDGKPPFVLMGVTADITLAKQLERDRVMLTRKLLRAQEMECARIARELHDDLGQFIALFTVQLHQAVGHIENESRSLGSPLRELYGKAGEIAHRVSTISHQLHSSELEFLGLAEAAKHFCREISDMHGIKVNFSSNGTRHTRKNAEFDLCLYRVLQEAVNNAVRHSQARKISVRLRAEKNAVSLQIEDDGVGFNADRPKRKRGLGLVSMSERLRLIGGECAVRSVPGGGTTIQATVPALGNGNK